MVCCWGRINRPFGAALSIGVTKTTRSPGSTRPSKRSFSSLAGSIAARQFFSSSIPARVLELTYTTG